MAEATVAESSEEASDRDEDDTDSDGREPSSKRNETTKFSGAFPSSTRSGKKTGPLFRQCPGISIVLRVLSARKPSVVDIKVPLISGTISLPKAIKPKRWLLNLDSPLRLLILCLIRLVCDFIY